ncbi:MAG: TlyA family RNA methyltransferase [Nitrospina sp.]|nr:TlyA family RNA methyltransferase [Nitrospina sp.]
MTTREKARAIILAGKVRIKDTVADKPGRLVSEDCLPVILGDPQPFSSRGGFKLEHALKQFDILPVGKTVVDVGASTGGFTDCLLQNGAEKVYAVDVGYGQLDWKLRNDPRVICRDRKNARTLSKEDIGETLDLAVIDVSFISLQLVIPPLLKILKPEGQLVALVKPQFEVGKNDMEHRGVIKDPAKHISVLLELNRFIEEKEWSVINATESPITGQKGNREFLIHCVDNRYGKPVEEDTLRKIVLN